MQPLTLHHYGFLTGNAQEWLHENELLLGKPYHVAGAVAVPSQKVSITFVQQTAGGILMELIEPWLDNNKLQKWITKGITVYHSGYLVPTGEFDNTLHSLEAMGAHALPAFYSEAFKNRRCIFLVTKHLGMIELIEE